MRLEPGPDLRVQRLTIGTERAPLLVIDNFVRRPEELLAWAASRLFTTTGRSYPGIRTRAPLMYRKFILDHLQEELSDFFELDGRGMRFSMCHYSLVTTPPAELDMVQRVPHVDSFRGKGIASMHYLFHGKYGGTAFYRHRKTGFEYVDEARQEAYFGALHEELNGPDRPGPEYINGDTPLFEQVARQDPAFNRILFYRRNSLHSGCVDEGFVPDANPLTGRLSINSFLDVAP